MTGLEEGRDEGESSPGFGQAVETSPDLLKNTPSNIARLEDAIEHSMGRQKYLARTKSPSDGEDVRWYFCKVPLAERELAASIPRTEIIGKSDCFRFSMRDSLALEASFLQREEELLVYWWKEYAEWSEGPNGTFMNNDYMSDRGSGELYAVEEERVGVPVKGGLYEVDLAKRHCFPIYWHGENRRVLRGHWFARKCGLDWLPLREDVAESPSILSLLFLRASLTQLSLRAHVFLMCDAEPLSLRWRRGGVALHAVVVCEGAVRIAWISKPSLSMDWTFFICLVGLVIRRRY